jgi:hypothetical protein
MYLLDPIDDIWLTTMPSLNAYVRIPNVVRIEQETPNRTSFLVVASTGR